MQHTPLGRKRVHYDMERLPNSILNTTPSDGIRQAFERAADLYATDPTFDNLALCINLWEVIAQMGCPEGDGSLLHYIDIITRG